MNRIFSSICVLLLFAITAQSQCLQHASVALSQPTSVMGAHVHPKGDLMFAYNYSYMTMEGMKEGNNVLNTDQVLGRYDMYAENMKMPMHMFMAMYAISDRVNIMTMGHYMQCKMDMLHAMGSMTHEMSSNVKGLGDTRVSALVDLGKVGTHHFIGNLGLSLPTGTLENRDDMSINPHNKMGYSMQFGSGTLDLFGTLSYTFTLPTWSHGAQTGFMKRNGKNSEGYALGNQYFVYVWAGRTLLPRLFLGGKLNVTKTTSIKGIDGEMMMKMSATKDPSNSGYDRLQAGLYASYQPLKNQNFTLHLEWAKPVVDNVTGIQMALTQVVYAGVKYAL